MRTAQSRFFASLVALLGGALLAAAGFAAHAQESSTIKKIRETGTITIGHRDTSIPFSYLDDKLQPVGYSLDICMRVIEAVKAELKLPGLKVSLTPLTSATRIPLITNGTVDLECGSTVNNPERQKLVSFSVTTFVVATRFVARKQANFKTIADLKGRRVVCTAGTNTVGRVAALNSKHNLGMTVITGKDHAESMFLMANDRADAFFEDDILLVGLASNAANPGDFALSTEGYSVDPYAIMLRREDPGFKRIVDDAIIAMARSGELGKLYDKWFLKPVPPKGINLNFPMGAALKKAIAKPTDSPDPADYQ